LPLLAQSQSPSTSLRAGPSTSLRAGCDRSVYYILHGRYDAALRQLEGAKTSGAAPADVENLRGLALMLSGDAKKAIASFDRALELQPALQEARFNRALALMRIDEHAKASAELENVFADEHSLLRADAAYHNGIALDRLGRPVDAETWLGRALALDAKLDAALLYTGFLRERRGDLQGAGRAYQDYLKAHPDSTIATLRFGIAAHTAGRTDVAKTYLERVIAKAPDSPEAIEARKFLVMWD
jgi:tetratricopeptide (TPR) repeat protein